VGTGGGGPPLLVMVGPIRTYVGLFAERTEITITNKSTTELEGELVKLLNDYVDVDYKDDDGTTREQEEGTFEDEEEGEGGEDDDAGDTEGEDR
jgi:hypothetical protein